MAAHPEPEQSLYGMVTNGSSYLLSKRWASSTLLGTGLGLSWQVNPYLSGRLDWGIPLNPIRKQGNSLQDNGIYFSIQFQPF